MTPQEIHATAREALRPFAQYELDLTVRNGAVELYIPAAGDAEEHARAAKLKMPGSQIYDEDLASAGRDAKVERANAIGGMARDLHEVGLTITCPDRPFDGANVAMAYHDCVGVIVERSN